MYHHILVVYLTASTYYCIEGTTLNMEKEYWEIHLPPYLQEDIDNLVEGRKINHFALDGLYNEVQSSINIAYYDGRIDAQQADYLRQKYLH